MMERVKTITGKIPLIIVAPHGPNDTYTDIMAELIAEELDCYAVINKGWLKAKDYDYDEQKANCNNMYHCNMPVVKEEFLDPIINFSTEIRLDHNECDVFILHGMGNHLTQTYNDLNMVLGYGEGTPSSLTCEHFSKDLLLWCLLKDKIMTYPAKAGSPYSGWARSNLNQLFRKWNVDTSINSFQLEIIQEHRTDQTEAETFGLLLVSAIERYYQITNNQINLPVNWADDLSVLPSI